VVNIGAGLADMKKKVLVVDLDPQAHLTYSLGVKADELEISVYQWLKGEFSFEQTVIEASKLKMIPASIDLASAEIELSTEVGREAFLKNVLEKVSGFDFVLLDCPPNLGLLTLNALTAAKEVFVPLQAEYLSIKGLNKLMSMIEKVQSRINPALEITGIITTLYDQRLKLHREVFENLGEFFGDKLFKTYIRRNVALAEASSFGKSIYEYAPSSNGAKDYRALCKEILKRGN
jgi:chromosome partitioning protein